MKRVGRRGKHLSLKDTTENVKDTNEYVKKDATESAKTPEEQQKEQEQKIFEGSELREWFKALGGQFINSGCGIREKFFFV